MIFRVSLLYALFVCSAFLLGCDRQKLSPDEVVGDYQFHQDSSTLPTGGFCFFLQADGRYGLGMAGLGLLRQRLDLAPGPGSWTIKDGRTISLSGIDFPVNKSGSSIQIVVDRDSGEYCELSGKVHASGAQRTVSPATNIVPMLTRTDLRVSFDVVKRSGRPGAVRQLVFMQPPDQLFTSIGGSSPELVTKEFWDQYFSEKTLVLPAPMTDVRLREGVANNQKDTAIQITQLLYMKAVPVSVRVLPKEGEVDDYGHPPSVTLLSACEFFSRESKLPSSTHATDPQ